MTVALLSQAVRGDPRTDAELLSRFLASRDQPAFAAIVQRHGPLVLGVCRRSLGDSPDADDAFQATFLVLVSKAGGLKNQDALGPWLFGVAHRIARKLRFKRARRSRVEQQVDAMPHSETTTVDRLESDELSRAFDEELANLPDDMRRAVVLCELQGLSRQAAAKELRVSEGTLSSRLGRARKKLAKALTKRGLGLAVPAAVTVGARLAASTTELATGAVVVPVGVGSLVQEALKTMAISKLKLGAVVLAAAVGCTLLAFAADKPTAKAEDKKAEAKPDPAKVVFKIGDQEVTRAEYAEFIFRRNYGRGAREFLEVKLIRAEADRRRVTVTQAEIEKAVIEAEEEFKRPIANYDSKDFDRKIRDKHGTRRAWVEHEVVPQLLLEKMVAKEAQPTDDEVKTRFENDTGERRSYQMWMKFEDAKKLDDLITDFNSGRMKYEEFSSDLPGLKELAGALFTHSQTGTLGRKAEFDWPEAQPLIDVLFAIKKEGEFARVTFPNGGGHRLVQLTQVFPGRPGLTFETQKPVVKAVVRRHKTQLLSYNLRRSLVDPVRDQFFLEVMKEFDPEAYAAYLAEVEKAKK